MHKPRYALMGATASDRVLRAYVAAPCHARAERWARIRLSLDEVSASAAE